MHLPAAGVWLSIAAACGELVRSEGPENRARLYGVPADEAASAKPTPAPLRLQPGPHLFVDDFLIEAQSGLRRVVNRPGRDPAVPNPLVTGREDHCFQPYMSVLRDPQTGVFRLWYGAHTPDRDPAVSHLGYLESADGIHWLRPHRVLPDPGPIQFGVSVIDEGPACPAPERRYKYGWWHDGGLCLAGSPDGLAWARFGPHPVLRHNHDINSIYRDPIRNLYAAIVSTYTTGSTWSGTRRVTMQSVSRDLLAWEPPWFVLTPDDRHDQGETQFYAMDGFLTRGDLCLGLVKVLRDDLKADTPPQPPEAYGIGYTALAWTRDGRTWTRDREPFFDRDPQPGAWDHAHAWIDEQLPVGEDVYLYYGGYARGHKVNRFEERQIGLVRMRRDRYVAREAGAELGALRTPLVVLAGTAIALNLDAPQGEAQAQLLGEDGVPLPGFTFADCQPVVGDGLALPLRWQRPLSNLSGRPVRLELHLRQARLFALELVP